MMTNFEIPNLELDLEKINPLFHKKMEQGASDMLSLDFMDFAVITFMQTKHIIEVASNYIEK